MLLNKTISIYTDINQDNNCKSPYIEINDITYIKNRPILMPGRPLTVGEAMSLFKTTSDNIEHRSYILPTNVLMWHTDSMRKGYECMFFIKSHIAPLNHIDLKTPLNVPWPSLVFKISYGRLKVFAIKNKKNRPTKNTKLYHVPAWNTSNGSVCTGNCTIKDQQSPEDAVLFWKNIWFNSNFTSEAGNEYPNLLELWKSLNGKKDFPVDILKYSSYCLGDI